MTDKPPRLCPNCGKEMLLLCEHWHCKTCGWELTLEEKIRQRLANDPNYYD